MSEPVLTLSQLVPGVAFPRHNENLTFEGLDLSNAILSGSVFRNCSFREVKLFKARVHGTQFVDCTFEGCDLGRVQGRGVLFMQCLMIGGSLHYDNLTFEGLDLSNAILSGSVFRNCSFREVTLFGSTVNGAEFIDCCFFRCDLDRIQGSRVLLQGCTLVGGSLRNALLPYGKLSHAQFIEVEATGVRLLGCRLAYTHFAKVTMPRAVLSSSHLDYVTFGDCNLNEADFQNSTLKRCILKEGDLEGVITLGTKSFPVPDGWRINTDDRALPLTRARKP